MLAQDELNPEALVALGDILVANGRREEAVEKYFKKCWKAHGGAECECKAHARLAFTSALRLAECYVEMEKFRRAVEVLDELQTFLRVNSGTGAGLAAGKADTRRSSVMRMSACGWRSRWTY